MKYVGSKNRLAKELAPIIQSYVNDPSIKGYIEPFVGGANMIDKIVCDKKLGFDSHKYLIALLEKARTEPQDFPTNFTENFYNDVRLNKDKYANWIVGLVGFCSFGAKWFGGYPRGYKEDKITPRDIVNESIRNLLKQASNPNFKSCRFYNKSFQSLPKDKIKGYVIYCDPPYRDTTKYSTSDFPYDEFYQWCRDMSKDNIVLISEYNMPEDFECIWSKTLKCSLNKNSRSDKLEKLFVYKGE